MTKYLKISLLFFIYFTANSAYTQFNDGYSKKITSSALVKSYNSNHAEKINTIIETEYHSSKLIDSSISHFNKYGDFVSGISYRDNQVIFFTKGYDSALNLSYREYITKQSGLVIVNKKEYLIDEKYLSPFNPTQTIFEVIDASDTIIHQIIKKEINGKTEIRDLMNNERRIYDKDDKLCNVFWYNKIDTSDYDHFEYTYNDKSQLINLKCHSKSIQEEIIYCYSGNNLKYVEYYDNDTLTERVENILHSDGSRSVIKYIMSYKVPKSININVDEYFSNNEVFMSEKYEINKHGHILMHKKYDYKSLEGKYYPLEINPLRRHEEKYIYDSLNRVIGCNKVDSIISSASITTTIYTYELDKVISKEYEQLNDSAVLEKTTSYLPDANLNPVFADIEKEFLFPSFRPPAPLENNPIFNFQILEEKTPDSYLISFEENGFLIRKSLNKYFEETLILDKDFKPIKYSKNSILSGENINWFFY